MSSGSSFHLNDWQCPDDRCRNVNFGKRTACNRCGVARPREVLVNASKKIGHEIGPQAAEKSHGLFSADDWQCGKCGNVNWARRNSCNMCSAPKVGEVERRTGLGGGYNEREGVEYKKRPQTESDDEYDDFGRKKRRKQPKSDTDDGTTTASKDGSTQSRRDRSRSPIAAGRSIDTQDRRGRKYGRGSHEDDDDDDENRGDGGDHNDGDTDPRGNGDDRQRRGSADRAPSPKSRYREIHESDGRILNDDDEEEDDDDDEDEDEEEDDDADLSKYDLLA